MPSKQFTDHPHRTPTVMRTPRSPKLGRARSAALLAIPALAGVAAGCTDLTETPPSNFQPSTFFQNEAQIQSSLAGVYSGLRATQGDYWAASEVSSDEMIVPTRGTDWFDGGQWIDLWRHTYGASSPAGNNLINGAYSSISNGIARSNEVLASIQNSSSATTDAAKRGIAEIRVLRAWEYYMLQDAFGGVPIITQSGLAAQPRVARDSVVRFILSELYAARPDLAATDTKDTHGRVHQGVVDAILSDLYLNYQVYTGTPTANGITLGATARYDSVVATTNRILNNTGTYSVATDSATWRNTFAFNNQDAKENIFVVRNRALDGLGLDHVNRATHYNSFANSGGWNGFSTIAEVYSQWDPADARRSMFLAGPQRSIDAGVPIKTRAGDQLVFSTEIDDITAAQENQGVRPYKFTIDPNHVQQNNGNDFTVFRVSGMLLNRAEANFRLGNTAAALADLNTVRQHAFNPPRPLTTVNAQVILQERLRELAGEGKRRQDLIRFGSFDAPRQFKTATGGFHALFPIPLTQLQANPQLTQNPGY